MAAKTTTAELATQIAGLETALGDLHVYAETLEAAGARADQRIANLEAQIDLLNQAMTSHVALINELRGLGKPAKPAAPKPAPAAPAATLTDALRIGQARLSFDHSRVTIRWGQKRWQLRSIPRGRDAGGMARQIIANVKEGGTLCKTDWERIA